MSLIGSLLGWTGLPQWALELLAIVLVAGGAVTAFWIYHHHVYVEGIHAQQVADKRASAVVLARAAAQTKAAQVQADEAHAAYLEEINHEAASAARRPFGPVRLCLDSNDSGSGVSQAGAAHPGNAGPGAPAGRVSQVPGANRPVRPRTGPDIAGLLELLAGRADQVSAVLREYQARNPQ